LKNWTRVPGIKRESGPDSGELAGGGDANGSGPARVIMQQGTMRAKERGEAIHPKEGGGHSIKGQKGRAKEGKGQLSSTPEEVWGGVPKRCGCTAGFKLSQGEVGVGTEGLRREKNAGGGLKKTDKPSGEGKDPILCEGGGRW